MDSELVELFEGGSALIVGAVDGDGAPVASRAWGIDADVEAGATTLRVLVPARDDALRAALEATGVMAVTATHLESLRSAQAKGTVREVSPADAADRARAQRHVDAFLTGLEAVDGTPPELAGRLVPSAFSVAVLAVQELYDQTPGPGAGRVIAGADAGSA